MDGGTWYPESYTTLGLKHILHSTFEKSIVERLIIEYVKDRTESFDDYYPCIKKECNLLHVYHG
jgi:putative transposase